MAQTKRIVLDLSTITPITCSLVHPRLTQMFKEIGEAEDTLIWRDSMSPLEDQLRSCLSEEVKARFGPDFDPGGIAMMDRDDIEILVFVTISLAFLAIKDQLVNNPAIPDAAKR